MRPDGTLNPASPDTPERDNVLARLEVATADSPYTVEAAKATVAQAAEGARSAVREEERSRLETAYKGTFQAIDGLMKMVRKIDHLVPEKLRERFTAAREAIEAGLAGAKWTAARETIALLRIGVEGTGPKGDTSTGEKP